MPLRGWFSFCCARSHGLRRGLRSCAPSELGGAGFALVRGSALLLCFARALASLGADECVRPYTFVRPCTFEMEPSRNMERS
jgi:hypothetical protein